jgi:hypothetical protein
MVQLPRPGGVHNFLAKKDGKENVLDGLLIKKQQKKKKSRL